MAQYLGQMPFSPPVPGAPGGPAGPGLPSGPGGPSGPFGPFGPGCPKRQALEFRRNSLGIIYSVVDPYLAIHRFQVVQEVQADLVGLDLLALRVHREQECLVARAFLVLQVVPVDRLLLVLLVVLLVRALRVVFKVVVY